MDPQNPISKIKEHRDALRKSERKVADFILDNAAALINMRIVDVARSAEVSEPTVLRFCRPKTPKPQALPFKFDWRKFNGLDSTLNAEIKS